MLSIPSPEYRRCPVTGRWVVLAPERALRPIELQHGEPHHRRDGTATDTCPICPGHEFDTPNEVYAVREPGSPRDGPGWHLRVVPNKFPAVCSRSDTPPHSVSTDGFFESVTGFGLHEVVIESDGHHTDPTRLTDDEFRQVLVAYRERVIVHARNPDLVYSTVFKNVGAEAGASLAHLHSQIVATPIVPDAIRAELEAADEYYMREGRCVFCTLVENERRHRVRVVAETERFVVLSPFAPRFAYELWVLPLAHDSRYEVASDADLLELAGLMRRTLGAIDAVLDQPAYNLFLHTGPLRAANLPYFHWHFEITPRTVRAAGFEWGSGCFINAMPPEQAAAELRAALG
jgi:UDPglucose--hexose-1-phosphate uridylyltransferase